MSGGSLSGCSVLLPSGEVEAGSITIDGERITGVDVGGGGVPDGDLVVPGFIDLQVNGIGDVDCAVADAGDWDRADEVLARTGVTAWLPTLVSQPLDRYDAALSRIDEAARRDGARPAVLGAHLEGPFLGGRPGAHRPEAIIPLDIDWLAHLPATVRLVTIAPEQAGAATAISALTARGVVVGLGHSDADFDTATAAFDAGARMVTHLFNAMAPLHHRRPGIAGAALADDRVAVGVIADLVHVHPALLGTAFRAKGPAGVVLVTDAVGWRAGRLAELDIALVDGAPRLPDGTLAGSSLTMDQAVRNIVDAAGVAPADALRSASTTPAMILGDRDRGSVAAGSRADLVVLDADDLSVRRTVVGGEVVWEA